jgi:hypothetical protein
MRLLKFICANCLISFILLIIPALEITYGITYNGIQCKSFTFFPSSWLLINGLLNCSLIITIFVIVYFNVQNFFVNYYFVILNILKVVWLFTGSIVFWKECVNIEPYDLNMFIWISICSGYVSLFNLYFISSTYERYTYNIDEPLLII